MKTFRLISIVFLLALLAAACGHPERNNLTRIIRLADTDHQAAAAALDSVDTAALSKYDRNLYSLIRIKIADKSYQKHTSADEIEQVIDYFRRHREMGHYPEALYYGGRVNSDLGDYPHALEFYQSALDGLPDDNRDLVLRSNVLSQLARLLNSMRLYSLGIPYLRQALIIDSLRKDTFNLVYDHQLLGAMLMHADSLDKAMKAIETGKKWAESRSDRDVAALDLYLAAIQYKRENYDSALAIIRPLPDRAVKKMRNVTLAYASEIYARSGVMDTACMYARRLVESPDSNNRKTGYKLLLSDDMIGALSVDSLPFYFSEYKTLLENYAGKNESRQFLIQNSMYNYTRHVKAREEAERESRDKSLVIMWAVIVIVLLGFTTLFMKLRQKRSLLKLHDALEKIRRLKETLETERLRNDRREDKDSDAADAGESPATFVMKPTYDTGTDGEVSLRLKLRKELEEISELHGKSSKVPDSILESTPYRRLLDMTAQNKVITAVESDTLWSELEKMIVETIPDFMARLNFLASGQLRKNDIQLAILMKCGFTATQIGKLLSITPGAVSSRKRRLGKRIYDVAVSNDFVDRIISAL